MLLTASGAALSLAIVAVLNIELYLSSRAHSHETAVKGLKNLALSIQHSVELEITSREQDLRIAMDQLDSAGSAQASLQDTRRVLPAFATLDAEGHQIAAASTGLVLPDIGETRFFQQLRDAPAAQTVVGTSRQLQLEHGLIVARRRQDAAGHFAGAVVSTIGTDRLKAVLGSYDLGDGGSITLIDQDGRLILSGNLAIAPGRDFSQSEPFLRVAKDGPGAFDARSQADGRRRVYVALRVPNAPVFIFVGTGLSTVYAPTRAVGEAEIVASLALLLLLAGFVHASRRELRLRQSSEQASRAAEAAARHSESILRSYFDNLSQGVLGVRVHGRGLEIERVNASAHRLLGVPEALLGREPQEVFAQRMPELVAELDRCLTTGRPVQRDLSAITTERLRVLRLTVTPVRCEKEGAITLLLANFEDVTLQERAQAQLLQSHRMDGIGRIASGVANEFNNLLQSLIGHLELLADEVNPETVAGGHALSALTAAARGTKLTQGLLSSSSQQVLQPARLAPDRVLAELRAAFEKLRDGAVTVATAPEHDVPDVFVDGDHLQSALLNLCQNGQEAMLPAGGTLTLRAYARSGLLASSGRERSRYVVLCVTDEGHGMSPDIMARAREPFFTTKGERFRSGLGLSMADGFARQSGGELRLESSPEGGTSVEIWLPAAEAPAEDVRPSLGGVVEVLLVDDAVEQLAMFQDAISEAGFAVTAVPSAEEALALLRAGRRFDLLVSDFIMPGSNGVELIGAALRYQPAMAALMITGAPDASRLAALPSTVDILCKPFRVDQLLRQMRQTIKSRETAHTRL